MLKVEELVQLVKDMLAAAVLGFQVLEQVVEQVVLEVLEMDLQAV